MKVSDMSLHESLSFFILLDLRKTLRYKKLDDLGLEYLNVLREEVDIILQKKYNIKKESG